MELNILPSPHSVNRGATGALVLRFFGSACGVAAVVVDGADRHVEHGGDVGALRHAQPAQCMDAQACVECTGPGYCGGRDAVGGGSGGIVFFHEIREDREHHPVEALVELLILLLDQIGIVEQHAQLVDLPGAIALEEFLAVVFKGVDILGGELESVREDSHVR